MMEMAEHLTTLRYSSLAGILLFLNSGQANDLSLDALWVYANSAIR